MKSIQLFYKTIILKFWKSYLSRCIFLRFGVIIIFYMLNKYLIGLYFTFRLLTLRFLQLELIFLVDIYSLLFIFTLFIITSTILFFRNDYIINEKFYQRFHAILIRFVASILLLILRPNLLSALLGWDGLGVTSYLLVIYYGRAKAYNAGIITAITNRLGDGILILCLIAVIPFSDTAIFWYINFWKEEIWLLVILVLARFTKRAQIPFSAWLPAAMAAPTPVSSLVHSSTLVTAGVYLLIRHGMGGVIGRTTGKIILILGSLTIFMASLSAFFERDIKKIVALSTLSQLGVIVVALGSNNCMLSFLHLLSHAYFKALLFVSVGNLIHSSDDFQALKITGGLNWPIRVSYSCVRITRLRLMGFPFMSAFFSKEPIIDACNETNWRFLIYLIIFVGVAMTAIYRVRLFILTSFTLFTGKPLVNQYERSKITIFGISFLFPLAIFGRSIFINFFFTQPMLFFRSPIIKFFVILLLITGGAAGIILSNKVYSKPASLWKVFRMWALPWISSIILFKSVSWNLKIRRISDMIWVWNRSSEYAFLVGFLNNSSRFRKKVFQNLFLVMVLFLLILLTW